MMTGSSLVTKSSYDYESVKKKKNSTGEYLHKFSFTRKKRKMSLVSWSLLSTTVEDEKNKYFLNKEHTTTYNAFDILRLGFTDHLP